MCYSWVCTSALTKRPKIAYVMDEITKRRVIGAAVLVALGVIFIPMFLNDQSFENKLSNSDLNNLDIPVPLQATEKIEPNEVSLLEENAMQFSIETLSDSADDTDNKLPNSDDKSSEGPYEGVNASETGSTRGSVGDQEVREEHRGDTRAWVIQFGSFMKEENAVNLLEQLRNRGYAAFITPVQLDANSLYKVRVGPQLDRDESLQIQARIESEFSLKGILINY